MSVAVQLKRIFRAKIGEDTLELEDLNPSYPISQIKKLYTEQYPELLNAQTVDKGIIDDCLVFSFESIAGSKG